MERKRRSGSVTRRQFLKIGFMGTAGLGVLPGLPTVFRDEARAAPAPVYRTLGRTGLKVTVVSFGAMLTPEWEVIRAGLDMGMNYVDTARRYMGGRNEEFVGRAIKGIRDKLYVATKTQPSSDRKEDIIKDVEKSLSVLGTDRIDVIQLHNLSSPDRAFLPEVREALLKLRQQGKVRFFGITTHSNQAEVVNALADDKEKFFDTALVSYNFKSRPEIRTAIARAVKAGMGITAMKTQAGGYKTDAMGPISPQQAALKWVLQDGNVSNAIPGMRTFPELNEDVAVMGMKFTARDERILARYGDAIDPYYCHLCGECEGTCPSRVEISVINRSLMYAEGYGEKRLARETFSEVKRGLSFCALCPECTARCPNGIDIAGKMDRARTLFT
jgi:predicted aldo/keto reductase-like oxidoreductase